MKKPDTKEITLEMVKITLKNGRNMSEASGGSAADTCGSCETSTNNHGQATCCVW